MSRTNVYTLIATALLGVLLLVVQRFTERLPTTELTVETVDDATAQRAAAPGYAQTGHIEGQDPRINSVADLVALLRDVELDGEALIAQSLAWRQARGFVGPYLPLGLSAPEAPRERYANLADGELERLSVAGDLAATQELAARAVTGDPFAALELYSRAADQGSSFAMLRLASLRDALGNAELDIYQSDPDYLRRLSALRADGGDSLAGDAFAYAFAAVRDAGLAIVDAARLLRLRRLMSKVPLGMDEIVCRQSEQLFLDVATARRQRGQPPVTINPPPLFFSVPNAADQLPCTDSLHPWESTQTLNACDVLAIEDARGAAAELYICA